MTRIRKGPSPRLTPEDAPLVASMVARAKDLPGGRPIAVLLAVAAEPDGARRKVAANVLGHVARGDAAIAAALRRLRSADSMSSAHRVAAREAIAKLSPPKAPR